MTEPFSPITAAVAELKAVAGMSVVYGNEPDPGVQLGPGAYVRWVRVRVLDAPPRSHMPVRDVTLGVQAYGVNEHDAFELGLLCESAFHDRGARKAASGLGIWHSRVISSGPDTDPDTRQPLWQLVVSYPTTINAIA
jgi:hypothetical protein